MNPDLEKLITMQVHVDELPFITACGGAPVFRTWITGTLKVKIHVSRDIQPFVLEEDLKNMIVEGIREKMDGFSRKQIIEEIECIKGLSAIECRRTRADLFRHIDNLEKIIFGEEAK